MASQDFKRKLTAIFSADVAGYSRLMGIDEENTVLTVTAHRELMAGFIREYDGRVVDSPGDNLLADFPNAVAAVSCAAAIQRRLREENALLPEDRRMNWRISINLGDVIVDQEHLYGDGVNLAARLENLTEAGGICISRPVYDQVEKRSKLGYEYLGEQQVKNIDEPVRVYRVRLETGDSEALITPRKAGLPESSTWPRPHNSG